MIYILIRSSFMVIKVKNNYKYKKIYMKILLSPSGLPIFKSKCAL